MSEIISKLQYVVIPSLYRLRDSEKPFDLWRKVFAMKIRGYRQAYPEGVLPFDASDFFAEHHILCHKQEDGELKPIAAQKSVSLELCDRHKVVFPMIGMCSSPADKMALKVVEQMIESYRKDDRSDKLWYNGSYTYEPAVKNHAEIRSHLMNLAFAQFSQIYLDKKDSCVLFVAAKTFKMHTRKQALGAEYLATERQSIATVGPFSLFNTPFAPMKLESFTEFGKALAKRYGSLWDTRIVMAEGEDQKEISKTSLSLVS